jgi:hypothetical protein
MPVLAKAGPLMFTVTAMGTSGSVLISITPVFPSWR